MTRTLVDGDGPGLRAPDQADRSLPARGPGPGPDRARPGLGGPRRQGLAAGRRVPRADRGPGRGRRSRPWPTPGTSWWAPVAAGSRSCVTPTGRCAGSRRSSTRTSRPRCSAADIGAEVLVIATDVEHVVLGYGTDDERPLHRVTTGGDARDRRRSRQFASGSMGPKVEAAVRFVESGGRRAVITSLEHDRGGGARASRHCHRTTRGPDDHVERPSPSRSTRSPWRASRTPPGSPT